MAGDSKEGNGGEDGGGGGRRVNGVFHAETAS